MGGLGSFLAISRRPLIWTTNYCSKLVLLRCPGARKGDFHPFSQYSTILGPKSTFCRNSLLFTFWGYFHPPPDPGPARARPGSGSRRRLGIPTGCSSSSCCSSSSGSRCCSRSGRPRTGYVRHSQGMLVAHGRCWPLTGNVSRSRDMRIAHGIRSSLTADVCHSRETVLAHGRCQ